MVHKGMMNGVPFCCGLGRSDLKPHGQRTMEGGDEGSVGRLLWLKIDNQPLRIFETDSRSFRVGTHAHGYLLRSLKPFDPTIYVQNWKEGKCFNPCLGLRLNMWCC